MPVPFLIPSLSRVLPLIDFISAPATPSCNVFTSTSQLPKVIRDDAISYLQATAPVCQVKFFTMTCQDLLYLTLVMCSAFPSTLVLKLALLVSFSHFPPNTRWYFR